MSDPLPADLQRLLDEEPFVRALARTLLVAEADEVVQETYLQALSRNASLVRAPRHWLARMVRNVVHNLRRGSERRLRRERAVAETDQAPSSSELMEREERRHLLVCAVDRLPRDLRTVVLLRFFESLPPRVIAVRLGVPAATVSNRLRKALAVLRSDLDREHAGSRHAWLSPLAFLAVPHAEAAGVLRDRLIGVLALTMKAKIMAMAAVAAVALGCLWFANGTPGLPGVAELESVTAAVPAPQSFREPAASARRQIVEPATTTSRPAPGVLTGRVLFADSGTPVVAAELVVRDAERGEAAESGEVRATTDVEGRFRCDLGERTVVSVEVRGRGCMSRRLPYVAVGAELEIQLSRGSRLVVEVRETRPGDPPLLEPVAGAACRLVLRGSSRESRSIEYATTDAAGETVFMVDGPQAHLIVERAGHVVFSELCDLDEGQERLRVVLPVTLELRGRVIDKRSQLPIAGATLVKVSAPALKFATDGEGVFRVPHAPRKSELWVVGKPGYASFFLRAQDSEKESLADVELEAVAIMTGSVSGFEGAVQVTAHSESAELGDQRWRCTGAANATGSVRFDGVPPHQGVLIRAADRSGQVGFVRVPAAGPGQSVDFGVVVPVEPAMLFGTLTGFVPEVPILVRIEVRRASVVVEDRTLVVRGTEYEVRGLAAGDAVVWALQGDVKGRKERIDLPDGGRTRLDLDLGPLIRGVVQDESGAGIADVIVQTTDATGPEPGSLATLTDPTGRFACATAHAGVVQDVRVLHQWRDRVVEPQRVTGVTPGGAPLRFLIRKGTLAIEGSVDSEILKSLRGERRLRVAASDALGNRVSASVRADGRFSVTVRDPGPHVVELEMIDASGSMLLLVPLWDVEAVRDVIPGGAPITLRAAPR